MRNYLVKLIVDNKGKNLPCKKDYGQQVTRVRNYLVKQIMDNKGENLPCKIDCGQQG